MCTRCSWLPLLEIVCFLQLSNDDIEMYGNSVGKALNLEDPLPQGRAGRDAKGLGVQSRNVEQVFKFKMKSTAFSSPPTTLDRQSSSSKELQRPPLVVCARCSWLPPSIKKSVFLAAFLLTLQ